jgi:hypothetical protein
MSKDYPGYMRYAQATRLFLEAGLSETTFRRKVQELPIRSFLPEGRSRGALYLEEDVYTAIEQSRKEADPKEAPQGTPAIIDWLSPRDIPAILRLDQIVYDEMFLAEMEVYRRWSEKNAYLAMAAFDPKSNRERMLAYVAALPLDEAVILSVLRGEREEKDLTAEEMQSYDRLGPYTLLANSAVSLPEYPELLNRILLRLIDAWVDRYPKRYVTRIYAQVTSESGDRMAQHFFMSPRYDLAPNAYMLDLARPGASKIIRRFQERLRQKAPLPEELQSSYEIRQ